MGRSRAVLLAIGWIACASGPPEVAPGEAAVWGRLSLVPREAAEAATSQYGDRRLRGVERVDYSHPGFSVLYVEGPGPVGGELELSVVDRSFGPRIEPAHGAVGRGGALKIANRSDATHVLSAPSLGVVRPLAPGERLRIETPVAGELELHVLDAGGPGAKLFVAPGPFVLADAAGDYALRGLEPGSVVLHAWTPRFPPMRRVVELASGTALRVDVEIGVGLSAPSAEGSDAP